MIIEYLGDWDNPFPRRTDLHLIVGIAQSTMYQEFNPVEMREMEYEGLELRKKNSARPREAVYKAMYQAAKSGDVRAMKEYLNRTEGKVMDRIKHSGGLSVSKISDEELDNQIRTLTTDANTEDQSG